LVFLIHFFNDVAGFPLFNDRMTFLQYLSLCSGDSIERINKYVERSIFDVTPGMLLTLMWTDSTNPIRKLVPMFLRILVVKLKSDKHTSTWKPVSSIY
jgi:hypothetical protein